MKQYCFYHIVYIYTHLSDRLALALKFYLSVRLSVKCVNRYRTKETYAHILIPYDKLIIVVFGHKEWLLGNGDVPFYLKFWAKLTHHIIVPQPSEKKSQLSLIGSLLCTLQCA